MTEKKDYADDVQMATEDAAAKSDAVAASDTAAAGDASAAGDAAAEGDAAAAGDGAGFDISSRPLTIRTDPIEPSDDGKKEFFRLVNRQMSGATFTNVAGFEEWFNKTLLPTIASDFGGNEKMGKLMITMTFGSIQQFMLFVLTKFTR